ncbi:MAG TPA: YidC/Oxa1 family membrane protein insertase [Solirubrobacteraceae bacterium]|nr:YidC/Oxa1 family membrane protein insertase [Solirubrobacteraceae bacterium]
MLLVTANIFQPLIDVFEAVLKFFHNSVGVPWGWSIVLLTVCVRAVLIPLTVRQLRSMARLQQLQPELKAIQTKYKDDKQRQQQEMMKFYKENNVNPLGSCLPLAAQLPVFISLYYMLRQSLRTDICPAIQSAYQHAHGAGQTTPCGPHGGAGFLFIPDLTDKATGAVLIVLILLYVGTQLGSSLMMSSATMDRTQRQIMLFMPLLFVLFVIQFPAGVLVYWITTNLWTIGQQYVIKRRIGPAQPAAAGGDAPGGSGPRPPRSGGGGTDGGGPPKAGPNGSGGGGGLAGRIRKPKEPEKEPVVTGGRGAPPPRPPRKKKKRSGRRR